MLKTKKCENECGRRYRVKDWHEGLRLRWCLTCDSTLRAIISASSQVLESREHEVLEWRFGIKDYKLHTFQEVGEKFGLSRERIYQIEKNALGKIGEIFYEGDYKLNGRFFGINQSHYAETNTGTTNPTSPSKK